MIGSGMHGVTRSPLRVTLAFGGVLGALAYAAGLWLSTGGLERSGFDRLAALRADNDPVTTGSIGKMERLDPCVVLRP